MAVHVALPVVLMQRGSNLDSTAEKLGQRERLSVCSLGQRCFFAVLHNNHVIGRFGEMLKSFGRLGLPHFHYLRLAPGKRNE